MPQSLTTALSIVRDETILDGDPRIEGTRIAVLHVYELAVDGDHPPADVADQLDVSLGDVYDALAYYYNHPKEMRARSSASTPIPARSFGAPWHHPSWSSNPPRHRQVRTERVRYDASLEGPRDSESERRVRGSDRGRSDPVVL